MAARNAEPAHGRVSSISSLESVSSGEVSHRSTTKPRRSTLLRNSIESSQSSEHHGATNGIATQPVQAPSYLGADMSSYQPTLDEQPRKKRLRERASFSKYYSNTETSRPAWPSSSTRDILKEAGDWLDAQYPVPDVQIPNADWHLASSPRQEAFPTSPRVDSRPTTSSTSKEEILDASEKIVFVPPEAKLRELVRELQRDVDRGTNTRNDREEKVKCLLRELQDKDDERAAQVKNVPDHVVELETIEARRESRGFTTSRESPERLSSDSDQSSAEVQAIRKSASYQSLQQTHIVIDLPTESDQQFSIAVAQALNFSGFPELQQGVTKQAVETEETPTGSSEVGPQLDETADCNPKIDQIPPNLNISQDSVSLAPEYHGDISTLDIRNEGPISEPPLTGLSSTTEGSTQTDLSIDVFPAAGSPTFPPLPESPKDNPSVFSNLDKLADAYRARSRTLSLAVRSDHG